MPTLSSPFTLIKKSFSIFFEKNNFLYFLKIYSIAIISAVISFSLAQYGSSLGYSRDEYFSKVAQGDTFAIIYTVIWSAVGFLIGVWVQTASFIAVTRVVNGGQLEFKSTYNTALKYFWKYLLLYVLMGLIIGGGMILLIVPGIIFAVWYSFSIWNLFEKDSGVIQSLKLSKAIVKGRFWKILGRFIIFILFSIFAQLIFGMIPGEYGPVLITIFGALFLLPDYLLYREVLGVSSN